MGEIWTVWLYVMAWILFSWLICFVGNFIVGYIYVTIKHTETNKTVKYDFLNTADIISTIVIRAVIVSLLVASVACVGKYVYKTWEHVNEYHKIECAEYFNFPAVTKGHSINIVRDDNGNIISANFKD